MADRIPSGVLPKQVRDYVHSLEDRLEKAEKVLTELVAAVLDKAPAKKAPAKAAAAKSETPADA